MKQLKTLTYAYPTSDHANALGFSKGCYIIQIIPESEKYALPPRQLTYRDVFRVFPTHERDIAFRTFERLDYEINDFDTLLDAR